MIDKNQFFCFFLLCLKKPNRLIHSSSPYLLQHAYNPVDWYPWGEEALEKAKKEDKIIFYQLVIQHVIGVT